MKKDRTALRLTSAAMAAALVFLFTFLIKVPTGVGYIHFGDALVFLYAAASGDYLALIVAALGEGLADIAGGFAIYFPATVLIKALMALPVVLTARKGHAPRSRVTILAVCASLLIELPGYFLADWILARDYAFVDLVTNAVQVIGSILIYVVLALLLEKSNYQKLLRHTK